MTSSAATGALGFVFWTVAARGYTTAEFGRASAVISSATLIAILATLSLGRLYERFLPIAGVHTRRLVWSGSAVVLLAALLFGTLFVILGPSALFTGRTETLLFPVCVMILAIFTVQDPVLIGIGRTRMVATKNIGQSIVKLVAVAAFIPFATGSAIVWAWVLPAAVITFLVGFRVIAPVSSRRGGEPDLPPRSELFHFFASSYAIDAVVVVVPLLVPLIIVARLGTTMNAYFSVCWLVISTLGVLVGATSAPYVAAASTPGADLRACTLRFTVMCGGAALACCAGLLVGAPLILSIVGPQYAEAGTTMLRLMALTLPALALMAIYSALSRLRRKLKLAVSVQVLGGVLIVSGIAVTSPWWGINAVGYSYLATEVVCTLILIGPTVRLLRRALASTPVPDIQAESLTKPVPVADRPLEFTSVIDQFKSTALQQSERVAVRTARGGITYGELEAAAQRWSPIFDTGDRSGVILLSAGMSPGTVAAVLGAFASDSVLVAVDPGLPSSRVQTIVRILDEQGWHPDILLTDDPNGSLAMTLGSGYRVESTEIRAESALSEPLGVHRFGLDDVTSIQFTSGSSGTPKAVMHGNGMWLCDAQLMHDRFGITPGRRVALCMPISFGAGLNVLTGSLCSGAEVVAIDPRSETPRDAFERIADIGAEVMVSTPAFLEALCTAAHGDELQRLDRIVTTGEAAHSRHVHRARRLAPHAVFTNWVGSSEASSIATYDIAPNTEVPTGAIPAGIPSPHKRIELDEAGAVAVSSRYLALRYLDPSVADSTFTENADGSRTFRGGDLGRWDDEGNLILLGRADSAVKIRGYLIEPAEVEAALLRYPEVREAVVVVSPKLGETNDDSPELTAYLAPTQDNRAPSMADLRARLHRDLPAWMVPTHLVILSALPRTERGKVDRQALPAPTRVASEPPRGKLESAIAEIWAEVLQLIEVGRTESFYALGGDSLTVTQMLARISDLHDVHLSHADLASAPTVAQFAETVAARSDSRLPAHRRRLAPTTVPIRSLAPDQMPETESLPVFCFAGAGASALTFVPLADRIGPGTPVYAFIQNGLENRAIPDWTVARAAKRHIADLRRLQRHGPYTLIGHSLGSYIALEVAHRLEELDETVDLVVLLDPFLSPGAVRGPRLEIRDAVLSLDGAHLDRRELWRRRMMLPLAGIVQRRGEAQAQALEEVGVRVGLMHRPRPWPGRALLVLSHLNRDDRRLWPYLLTGDLVVETLECDHNSIVREPYISAVVDLLAANRLSAPTVG
ncbi:alpha/beta fold hydrolase [Mycobacterium sp. 141]|uniref:alpha/beta fold hydrolase n=1 Tax=Mycobacterium sp. 141 TaxID=1120797 RepID=UPI0003685151|nr:alpha/beta fold hydrolase [Mycobacterium sp. 141]